MLGAGYGTISDIEVMWVLLAAIGFIFSALSAYQALGDRNFLRNLGVRNGRWLIANLALFNEAGRSFIQAVFLTIGLLAMLLPEPPNQGNPTTVQEYLSIIVRWGLISSSVVLTTKSVYTWHTRRRLLRGD